MGDAYTLHSIFKEIFVPASSAIRVLTSAAESVEISGVASGVNLPVSIQEIASGVTIEATIDSLTIAGIDTGVVLPVSIDGEVEVKNDTGNPLDVSLSSPVEVINDSGTTLDVDIASSVELEVKNDAGNPLSVSWTGQSVSITGEVDVDINSLSYAGEFPVSIADPIQVVNDSGTTLDVDIVSSVELEVKNDTGNPLSVSWTGQSVGITGTVDVDIAALSYGTLPVNVQNSPTVTVNQPIEVINDSGTNLNVSIADDDVLTRQAHAGKSYGQKEVDNNVTPIVAANSSRDEGVLLVNNGDYTIYVGLDTGVQAGQVETDGGTPVFKKGAVIIPTTTGIWAVIEESGVSSWLSYIEV